MYFNWISTASFVAGSIRVSTPLVSGNAKLIQHWFITSFVFELGRVSTS